MSHLLSLFLLVLLPARGCSREEPQKLCAHNFIRALVWVCGGPRWASPEGRQSTSGDRHLNRRTGGEILQLLQKRPFRGMAPDTNTEENLDVGLVWRPGLLADAGRLDRAHRWRRAPSPAKHCCNNGCTKQDLLTFCPH